MGCIHARTYTRTHIHLNKLVTTMSRLTASWLDKKEHYSCLYSIAKPKVWPLLFVINSCCLLLYYPEGNFTKVFIIVMASIMSVFMLTLLHQTELEV